MGTEGPRRVRNLEMELNKSGRADLADPDAQGSGQNTEARFTKAFLDIVVLNQLSRKPTHGYELMQAIQINHRVTIRSGTLYPLLHRLEKRGMLCGTWQAGGRPRKTYTLTGEGLHYLRQARRTARRLIEGTS